MRSVARYLRGTTELLLAGHCVLLFAWHCVINRVIIRKFNIPESGHNAAAIPVTVINVTVRLAETRGCYNNCQAAVEVHRKESRVEDVNGKEQNNEVERKGG